MKIAFLGNCQLNNVGNLFIRMAQEKIIDDETLWTKPVFELTNADYLPLLHALDSADVIYAQYHDTYHGMYATNHLSKYFKFKIVPTLESFVSTPQMSSWSGHAPIPYNLGFIDFRILDLYLQKIDAFRAAAVYEDVNLNEEVVHALINKSVAKYKNKFDRKLVCFNYAPFYLDAMQHDIESYYTMNHPSNRHLEWLTNSILRDMGSNRKLLLDKKIPELLGQFLAPSLRTNARQGKYVLNAVPMKLVTAIKMYYAYFDTLDGKYLESELQSSVYHSICSSVPPELAEVTAQNRVAARAKVVSNPPELCEVG